MHHSEVLFSFCNQLVFLQGALRFNAHSQTFLILIILLNTTTEKYSDIGMYLHGYMMLKENVPNNYGNASFPKFLWAVQLITEAVWSPTRLTKQLLLSLLQLPSGNSCTAAGGHFSEFLKNIFSQKQKEVNLKVCSKLRAAYWSHGLQASKKVKGKKQKSQLLFNLFAVP